MAVPVWAEGLTRYGLYSAGIVDESQLDEIREIHKRDTVSTFGTCSSRRVTKKTTKQEPSKDDCSASRPSNNLAIYSYVIIYYWGINAPVEILNWFVRTNVLVGLSEAIMEAQYWWPCGPLWRYPLHAWRKAADGLPVQCPLQTPKSTTNKRVYLQGTRTKGCRAHIEIGNEIETYGNHAVSI